MIRMVQALNFRSLRHVKQSLDQFHVLVGPNASGKTTFFDVIRFLGDLVSNGLEAVVRERTENLKDLVWRREGDRFELAVELAIREEHRKLLQPPPYDRCRYQVAIEIDPSTRENVILVEHVLLMPHGEESAVERTLFPEAQRPPYTILRSVPNEGPEVVVRKAPGWNDSFYNEVGGELALVFKLGPRKSALANLPEDESKFPVSTWLKRVLIDGIESLVLNSTLMRKPSPPGQPKGFRPDGSNLPWVIEDLRKRAPERLAEWIAHLRTALPDLEEIHTVERPEDRHRYVVVRYRDGLEVPSWMVSDGTLRLLALTLPAYIPDLQGIYLIEEPENGIHPRAVETMFQSLSSVCNAQVLLATHSPVILSLAEPRQGLCFARTEEGATDIIRGSEHPALREWRGETNLGVLCAAGVLG